MNAVEEMARWSSLYRYGAKGRGMQAVARKASASIPMPSRIEQALRAVPSVSQAQQNWPAPPPLSAVLQDLSPELGYAERDRVLKKISLAAQLHQADHATVSYLGHFAKTLTESLGEDAKPVLPIFQELLAAKELRSRYLERRRSLLEQKQAAESSTLHLKVAIAALEDSPAPLKEQSQEQPPGKTPERMWRSLGLADSAPPSVPPSYGGPTVVGGLPGMQQRMKMRYESQVPATPHDHGTVLRSPHPPFTHPPTPHHTHTLCPPPPPRAPRRSTRSRRRLSARTRCSGRSTETVRAARWRPWWRPRRRCCSRSWPPCWTSASAPRCSSCTTSAPRPRTSRRSPEDTEAPHADPGFARLQRDAINEHGRLPWAWSREPSVYLFEARGPRDVGRVQTLASRGSLGPAGFVC